MVFWWLSDAKKPRVKRFAQTCRSYIRVHFEDWGYIGPLIRASGIAYHQTRSAVSLDRLGRYVIRPLEAANGCWLVFIVLAQTFGVWQRCECLTSSWDGTDYMDLTQWAFTNSKWAYHYWIAGTATSVSTMALAIVYICIEWCVQSHLSTSDPEDAADGLQITRRFRVGMKPLRWLTWEICRWGRKTTLKWTKHPSRKVSPPNRSTTLQREAGTMPAPPLDEGHVLTRPQAPTGDGHLDTGSDMPSGSPSPKPSSSDDPHAQH